MSDKAFFVDTSKCSGCRGCQVACKEWNGLPGEKTEFFGGTEYTNPAELSAITWNHVKFSSLDRRDPIKPVWSIMHKKCYHCETANCITVCPEKAISKVDGWTIIDQSKCIGCGTCENECIYKVPHVSEKTYKNDMGQNIVMKDKAHKCNACMLNERDIPACVATCPTGALRIGNRSDMLKKADERVKELKKDFPNACVYGKKEFDGLRVITVLKDKPERYSLPVNVKPAEKAAYESIKDVYSLLSLFTLGLPSLKRAAYKMARTIGSRDV